MEREVVSTNRADEVTVSRAASADHEAASSSTFAFKEDFLRNYDMNSGNVIIRIIRCYRSPGLHEIGVHRFGQWLKKKNLLIRILLEPVHRILFHRILSNWGIEISQSAKIGAGFYIGHYGGITISGLARIGRNVNISQLVTIGVSGQGQKWRTHNWR